MPIKDNFEEGCNEAKCKSCLFGPTPIHLTPERQVEIATYLSQGTRHICHVTNKTCYGALELQAKIFFHKGVLSEPTVHALITEGAKYKAQ